MSGLRRDFRSGFRRALGVGVCWLAAACSGTRSASDANAGAFRPLAVGDTVAPYAAVALSGDTVHVGPGEPITLVNVWATWCESCREEMADLAAIERDYAGRGLRLVAVSVDQGSGAAVRRFVDDEHLSFLVAHDPDGVVRQRFRTTVVPESYLVGTDGRLLWRQAGGIHGDPAAARAAIAQALARTGGA